MSNLQSVKDFYDSFITKVAGRFLLIAPDGFKLLISGIVNGTISRLDTMELFDGAEIDERMFMKTTYAVESLVLGSCYPLCDIKDSCAKTCAICALITVFGKTAEQFLCMDSEDLGLIVSDSKSALLSDTIVKILPHIPENLDKGTAYEVNKTREQCILCGEKTIDKNVFFSVIKYCPCVEK